MRRRMDRWLDFSSAPCASEMSEKAGVQSCATKRASQDVAASSLGEILGMRFLVLFQRSSSAGECWRAGSMLPQVWINIEDCDAMCTKNHL